MRISCQLLAIGWKRTYLLANQLFLFSPTALLAIKWSPPSRPSRQVVTCLSTCLVRSLENWTRVVAALECLGTRQQCSHHSKDLPPVKADRWRLVRFGPVFEASFIILSVSEAVITYLVYDLVYDNTCSNHVSSSCSADGVRSCWWL